MPGARWWTVSILPRARIAALGGGLLAAATWISAVADDGVGPGGAQVADSLKAPRKPPIPLASLRFGNCEIAIVHTPVETDPGETPNGQDVEAIGNPWREVAIEEGAFDRFMYEWTNSQFAEEKLEALLQDKLRAIERRRRITEDQKRKLLLAGRGDIHRLFHRVEAIRPTFDQTWRVRLNDLSPTVPKALKVIRAAESLRKEVRNGPFGPDSMFTKILEHTRRMEEAPAN